MNPFKKTDPVPIVQQAEATEKQLIEKTIQALTQCRWVVGQCAAEWTEKHARGRSDADFGNKVGITRDQVNQRRRVWEEFSDVRDTYHNLSWSHFYTALSWDDSTECLQWADEVGSSISEMKAWRRSRRGEDLTQPEESEEEEQSFVEEDVSEEPSSSKPQNPTQPARKKKRAGGQAAPAPTQHALPDSSQKSEESPEEDPLNFNKIVEQIRKAGKAASVYLEKPEEISNVVDELKRWQNVLEPQRFRPPTIGEVQEYMKIRKSPIDPVEFHQFYDARNWMSGKTKLKNWKSCIVTWERRREKDLQTNGRVQPSYGESDDGDERDTEVY